MVPGNVPQTTFHIRIRDPDLGGPNPYVWKEATSGDIFGGRNIVLFAVPGAYTPACSETHLPGFEAHAEDFRALGVDEVICLAVNDAFVMHNWAKSLGIEQVAMLPDGNGDFSAQMGMLVERTEQGMGRRSWRYSMYVVDGAIQKAFVEPGLRDNPSGIPVKVSGAETMLEYLGF
ncbi:peroxiredoxin [Aliiruegeria lutimaris]|uniref:Glutathione-dependent peroxiredoxin n=1 Tax=Aliiruegeria lutimaris TaxID=571298 RepID=A0A1G9Q315_9RHOB|nr:peroxiredoxin [Aliiruegeria lutimaris]SDM05121.1 peroxiredoxin (alkyl hydroperoxide reductase subunit C) [Aliiruegeria lutimaris]